MSWLTQLKQSSSLLGLVGVTLLVGALALTVYNVTSGPTSHFSQAELSCSELNPAGDVNSDGTVNVNDATFILQYTEGLREASNQTPLPEGTLYLPNCDINQDNQCSVQDASIVMRCGVGLSPEVSCSELSPGSRGDVSGDGKIDVTDAMFILQYEKKQRRGSNQKPPPEGALYLPFCDINSDGSCNLKDAQIIMRCGVGLPAVCSLEPADSCNGAGSLVEQDESGDYRLDYLCDNNDADRWKVYAESGETLLVTVTDPGQANYGVELYEPGCDNKVATKLEGNIYHPVTKSGIWVVRVYNGASSTADSSKKYQVNVTVLPSKAAQHCPADLNGDGRVTGLDLSVLVSLFGSCKNCTADLDNDGVVDNTDLLTLTAYWGACPAANSSCVAPNLSQGKISQDTITLSWNAVTGASKYVGFYNPKQNNTFSYWRPVPEMDQSQTRVQHTNLKSCTEYAYHVKAVCGEEESAPSEIIRVRTACNQTTPQAPTPTVSDKPPVPTVTTPTPTKVPTPQLSSHSLNLVKGWNQKSLAIEPDKSDLPTLLKPIEGKFQSVFAYENNGQEGTWKFYKASGQGTLKELHAGDAFWIYMKENATLTYQGLPIPQTQLEVKSGWNLLGISSLDPQPVENLIDLEKYADVQIFTWAAGTEAGSSQGWLQYPNDFTQLKPGEGYWIYPIFNQTQSSSFLSGNPPDLPVLTADADVNDDGFVNGADVARVVAAYNTTPDDPEYLPEADFWSADGAGPDGKINSLEISRIRAEWSPKR